MKLELKHLAPYLPYKLKMQTKNGSIYELNIKELALFNLSDSLMYNHKPILRPLSDLINKDDYPYLISEFIDECHGNCDAYDEWLQIYIDNPEQSRILQAPYEVIIELFANRFDVFGLINEGLAIDINTLKS